MKLTKSELRLIIKEELIKLNELKYPKLVDFNLKEDEEDIMTFDKFTKEYKILDNMSIDTWEQYINDMAKKGWTTQYDNINDEFVLS